MNRRIRIAIALLIILVVGIGAVWYWKHDKGKKYSFRTAQVTRGDLRATISATGTVEPEEVVDVGAQVAGQIISFGKDKNGKTIDYGSQVEEETVLAQIDDSLYRADVATAQAQLAQAKATYVRDVADMGQLKAKLDQANRDWTRAQKIGPSEALAKTTYDNYRATFLSAQSNLEVGKATIEQAKASIAQSEAALQRAQRNLGYCTIKSPVKGVIVDRRVNIGQTVVSSLNAPSLFLIAKDLKRMQVWVSVNEADIGNLHPGQPASFTVDAYPGQVFKGSVGKIRLNATMTQNVVTYTVEVITDNSSGKLLPYLTANVQFELAGRTNVLLVPNAALRWLPQPEMLSPKVRATAATASRGERSSTPGKPAAKLSVPASPKGPQGKLWLPQGSYVRPISVHVGLSDGTVTEVSGNDVKEGIEVVVGEQTPEESQSTGTVNPFTPQLRRSQGTPASGQR